jgi:hypothetical protein
LRPLAVRALYACERVDLGTNGCVEAVERLPFDRRMLMREPVVEHGALRQLGAG